MAVVNNEPRGSHVAIKRAPLIRVPFKVTENVPNFTASEAERETRERERANTPFISPSSSSSFRRRIFRRGFSVLFNRNGGSVRSRLDSVLRPEPLGALQPGLRRSGPSPRFAGEEERVIGDRDDLRRRMQIGETKRRR